MKKNIINISLMFISLLTFLSCSDKEPFSSVGPDDNPRILSPSFPDRSNGELAVFSNILRDTEFTMDVVATPSEWVTVTWYIDGEEAGTGTSITRQLSAGTYNLRIVATIPSGKSTTREGLIVVRALDEDPWATTVSYERIVAPGTEACLFGDNLQMVKSIIIGGHNVETAYDETEDRLTYTLPEDIASGKYRIELVDAEGNTFGGDCINVTSDALVTDGEWRMNSNAIATISGVNLNRVESLEIGGKPVTEIVEKTPNTLSFRCPSLDDGKYTITGKTNGGGTLAFYTDAGYILEHSVIVSSLTVLFEGHHYVSWELADGDPNKTFNLIPAEYFDTVTPGTIMTITYSVEPTAGYTQVNTVTGWWTQIPGTSLLEVSEGGSVDVVLTAEALALIREQAGFLCVGHGYYVDLVTVN